MSRTRPYAIFICLLSAALFGVSTPASKSILNQLGPLHLAGLLYLGAAIAVLPFSFKGGSPALRRRPSQIKRLAGAIVFGGVIGPVLLLYGLSRAPAASVALWLNLETVATAILGWLIFREHMGRTMWTAIALVVIAGAILVSPSGFGTLIAALLVTLACVSWGIDNSLTAIIEGYTPAQITLAKGLVAGTVNLLLGFAFEGTAPSAGIIIAGLLIGAFSFGFSIQLYISGAQLLGATRSQMLFATSPFFGTFLSWSLLGEPVEITQIIAAVIMAGGLVIMFMGRHEHAHVHEPILHTHGHIHGDSHHDHSHEDLPENHYHVHEHGHDELIHSHPHEPDIHHRHNHDFSGEDKPEGR